MSLIEIKQLTKDYDSNGITVHALRGVTMSVGEGEFTAIAGPSGSGKTTLLNIIGGLDSATQGKVHVGQWHMTGLGARELSDIRLNNIGFVFQAYNLIPVLTALENVEFIMLLQGIDPEKRRERAASILDEVGLGRELTKLPKQLSGGQQQRVAVARAIVSEPEIVLADEPTANLDSKTGADLLDMMHELNQKKKVTFIFSTHDQTVMDRAERLVHLTDGKISDDEWKKKPNKRGSKTAGKKKGSAESATKRAEKGAGKTSGKSSGRKK